MSQKKGNTIVTRYKINSGGGMPQKIALVTDLHDRSGQEALELLRKEKPDLIAAAGDFMERCDEENGIITSAEMERWQEVTSRHRAMYKIIKTVTAVGRKFWGEQQQRGAGLKFLIQAAKIAPVCYSVGNHEWYFLPEDYRKFKENHIILLDNEDIEFITDSGRVLIGGLSTRYDLDWLKRFGQKKGTKILLCHHPEYYKKFIRGTGLDQFDLVLSGHVHGGQWRIGTCGILAPGQGFFPEYCYGMYDKKLIISGGLANTAGVPRFGNPKEIVIIEQEKERN
ncbi:Uncharacterized metallophosphoesterase Cj0846 [uncultured Roseburia sp.]|uniref:Metallophosphoesterase n=1 Tax=Brotonthovivens ammoniilytica TaxID=2981725 RepID=A0ABT2TN16_9FIRM|nr:metallophosphoesterase [Brotonthovivens ammoniilytica]MCU6763066.1 metallophosphoesterase [Brotonthovivens ammoniilytica]SCJ02162.1 Uncharacterized metallophosphoesterase Cj0846 [uncultured Roseburia sp.]